MVVSQCRSEAERTSSLWISLSCNRSGHSRKRVLPKWYVYSFQLFFKVKLTCFVNVHMRCPRHGWISWSSRYRTTSCALVHTAATIIDDGSVVSCSASELFLFNKRGKTFGFLPMICANVLIEIMGFHCRTLVHLIATVRRFSSLIQNFIKKYWHAYWSCR